MWTLELTQILWGHLKQQTTELVKSKWASYSQWVKITKNVSFVLCTILMVCFHYYNFLYLFVPFCTSLYHFVHFCAFLYLFVPLCIFFVALCTFEYFCVLLYILVSLNDFSEMRRFCVIFKHCAFDICRILPGSYIS